VKDPARMVTLCVIALGAAGGVRSEEPGHNPVVILRGEGESERAPHGEGNVYAPDVMCDGNVFRMWYGGQGKDGHDRIAYAESVDGKTWARKGVVLEDAGANHVNDPSVVKVGGVFLMFYTRAGKDVVDRIDLATSDDGKTWEPKGVVLGAGPDGSWDSLSVGRPAVLHEDGLLKMWYDGRKDFPPGAPVRGVPRSPASRRGVGYATSRDGLRWARRSAAPVFGHDAGGVDVKRWGETLVMTYESREGTRLATSKNGTEWADAGFLAHNSGGKIDAFGHVTPCLRIDPDRKRHRLYIGAAEATTWDRNRIAVLELSEDRLWRTVRGTAR